MTASTNRPGRKGRDTLQKQCICGRMFFPFRNSTACSAKCSIVRQRLLTKARQKKMKNLQYQRQYHQTHKEKTKERRHQIAVENVRKVKEARQ